jgi:hypothetical protein|nr:MAG TPA: KilA-N domain [Caudoviricetes sp.]
MTNLVISNTSINFNNGLYSLNDLHKASGGDMNNQPSNFLKLDSTKALTREISNETNKPSFETINGGNNQGSYVCKELLIAYAMWISPELSVKILRSVELSSIQNVKFSKSCSKQFKTYILKNKLTNMIKIGKTTDFVTRRRMLETYNGVGLELLALIDNDIEAALHEKFKKLKLFSEWFDASSGEIEEYAKSLKQNP